MATDFDNLVGGGASMASGFAGLAAMFSGMQQQRAQNQQLAFAREQENRNFLQRQNLLDREMLLQETQLRTQARQQAEQMQLSRQESAFDQLNRTLTLQMEMADRESQRRDRAFALSQQAIANDLQTKQQMLQLRAYERSAQAAEVSGELLDLTTSLAVAMGDGDDTRISEITTQLEKHVRSPYFQYFDKETQGKVFNEMFLSKQHISKLTSLDPENLTKNYTIPEAALEISGALRSNRANPKDLQALSYLKEFMINAGVLSPDDKVISDTDVETMQGALGTYFSDTNARTIGGWLNNPGHRKKLADELTKLPNRPLNTEERSKYLADTRQIDEIERRIRAGLFEGSDAEKSAVLQYLNANRSAAFFSAAGATVPEMALQKYETYDPDRLLDGYIDYAFDDTNVPADKAPFSARKYYVQPKRTGLRQNLPIPVDFGSKVWKTALKDGTLVYDQTESIVDPSTGKTEASKLQPYYHRFKPVTLPVEVRRAVQTIANGQDQLAATLRPGSSSTFLTTPDTVLQGVFNAHEQAIKAIDLNLRGGQSGNDTYLDVRRFMPMSSIVKADIATSLLQRMRIPLIDPNQRRMNPRYQTEFINLIQNMNPSFLYQMYLPRTSGLSGQNQIGQNMGGGSNMSGQQPATSGNVMQSTFGEPLND